VTLDFLKLLRSVEDLLFEVLTWIIYYPRTLWMVMRHPLQMIDYSDHEQSDDEQEQYTDTMSPPLLLLLTLVIGHVLEVTTRSLHIKAGNDMARMIVTSDQNLIALRAFLFGLLPLFAAQNYVKHKHLPLERKHLRAPFFGECYVAAIFALLVIVTTGVAAIFPMVKSLLIPLGVVGATAWFLTIETLQMRRALGFSTLAALTRAAWILAKALLLTVLVGVALAGGLGTR
jgi:hypothetical protein